MAEPSPGPQSTDEERLARLSSSLCTLWSMVHRGIWPRQLLTRFFPPEIVHALPAFQRDLSNTEVTRTTRGLVSITSPKVAHATKALLHPEGSAEAVYLSFGRKAPDDRWQVTRFVPFRYRNHQLALARVAIEGPEQRVSGLRPDILVLLGPPPPRGDLRADYLDAAGWLAKHAHRHAIPDLAAHIRRATPIPQDAAKDHAMAIRIIDHYKLLANAAAHEQARTALARASVSRPHSRKLHTMQHEVQR